MRFSNGPLAWLMLMRPSAPLVAAMRVDLKGGGWGCGTGNVALILDGGGVELRQWRNGPKSPSLFWGGNRLIYLGFIWGAAMWYRPM
jgi:hypothetical protein